MIVGYATASGACSLTLSLLGDGSTGWRAGRRGGGYGRILACWTAWLPTHAYGQVAVSQPRYRALASPYHRRDGFTSTRTCSRRSLSSTAPKTIHKVRSSS